MPSPSLNTACDLPSLFVVSLPRSLSSGVYHIVRRALNLRQPEWTSDGELLNMDRFIFHQRRPDEACRKFTTRNGDKEAFDRMLQFLDQTVARTGFAYKDVIQPFVSAAWLMAQGRGRGMPVLRIRRSIADVAYSMAAHKWFYPATICRKGINPNLELIRGLLKAEAALNSIKSETVEFDEMIFDEEPLKRALEALGYGELAMRVRYIDERFEASRGEILRRRKTKAYRMLAELLEEEA